MIRNALLALLLAGAFCATPGCDMLNADGKVVPAAYHLPKERQILIFVDGRPGYGVPLEVPNTLAQSIVKHLNKYKAADHFVNPEIVTQLKEDPVAFEGYDVMTVAQKAKADVVLFVDLWQFQAATSAGGLTTEGTAQAFVRAVDNQGNRLWPQNNMIPVSITANVPTGESTDQPLSAVKAKLIQDMSTKIGRLFHDSNAQDHDLNIK